jgi:hypothetical protein
MSLYLHRRFIRRVREREENTVNRLKNWGLTSAIALAICCGLALTATLSGRPKDKKRTQALDAQGAPMFKVDPFWPKPLPNRWSMQQVTGLYVEEKNDHVWFLNRAAAADGDEIGGDGNPPGSTAASADRKSSSWTRKAMWSTPGEAQVIFLSGPRLCKR